MLLPPSYRASGRHLEFELAQAGRHMQNAAQSAQEGMHGQRARCLTIQREMHRR